MKRFISLFLAAMLVFSAFSITVFAADDVVYIGYNKGNNTNDGLSDTSLKKSLGTADGNGGFGVIRNGGTMVVVEKLYIGDNYTWNANGATTITGVFGGKDYKNTSPATNPASGVIKIKPACTLTVASDLTIDDVILFSESKSDTIRVTNGATLTITESVISMSKGNYNFKIVVEKGAKAIINGGIFDSVNGDGEIVIGEKATVAPTYDNTPTDSGVVAYISYNSGDNNNDGLTESTPKRGLGSEDSTGIISLLKKGGTVVVCGKMYVGSSYAWNAGGNVVITANHGGKDYKNTEPAKNPASGVIKFKPGSTFTVGSNLTLDDVILFQENAQCTIVVSPGATFTVNESVIAMSNKDHFMKIVVTKGGKAVINGGIFDSVSGDGEIIIGEKAKILGEAEKAVEEAPVLRETIICYLDYNNGNNANNGYGANSALKTYSDGVFKHMAVGGTIVVSGESHISGSGTNKVYEMPLLMKKVTFTSKFGGSDFRDNAKFFLGEGTTLKISSDVIFDSIVLKENDNAQSTIHVTNNATLTVTDTVSYITASNGSHYKLVLDKGTIAILSKEAQEKFTITGEGTVITYKNGYMDILEKYIGATTILELTINSEVAYVNGEELILLTPPINRNNRTLLPVRNHANTFGIYDNGIKWDTDTRTATLSNDTTTIVITIDAPTMTVNGQSVELDSPAIIENDRTYLPVRAIANALGVSNENILWDASTNTATLIK